LATTVDTLVELIVVGIAAGIMDMGIPTTAFGLMGTMGMAIGRTVTVGDHE
jgi:hypothetical protein